MTYLTEERHRAFGPAADRFLELVGRYPKVASDEVEEMIALYSRLTILEAGLLSSDEAISTPLDAFVRAHSKRLRRSWQHHFVIAAAVAATLASLAGLAVTALH